MYASLQRLLSFAIDPLNYSFSALVTQQQNSP